MARRDETQIAIRIENGKGGHMYITHRQDRGRYAIEPLTKLTLETANEQLSIYSDKEKATIVTRRVIIIEDDWVEVENSNRKQLAELLHKKQCHGNHIDQCSWDTDDWNGYTRKQYLEKAEKILKTTSFFSAKELLEIL